MARAQAAGHVLIGYYVLPSHIDQPIESTINPQGLAVRCKRRVWNTGDGRLKFLIIRCVLACDSGYNPTYRQNIVSVCVDAVLKLS